MQYLNISSVVKRAANNGIPNIGFRGNPNNIIEILIGTKMLRRNSD